eukprot:GFUD01056314.1.p1 GENE.GFUD01056314.1~~GFUD01056314.1.p1  ORF type:complete len:173 (-),score=39.72 GFUD01056314.1:60-578(-)
MFHSSNSLGSGASGGFYGGKAQPARIWLYCKNLRALGTAPVSASLQHWAVVVEYLDEDKELDMSELYEAGVNDEGFVVTSNMAFSRSQAKEWMKEPGASKKYLGEKTLNQKSVLVFCAEFTKKNKKYTAFKENCQKFVKEFESLLDGDKLKLPPNAEQSCLGKSKNSCPNVC